MILNTVTTYLNPTKAYAFLYKENFKTNVEHLHIALLHIITQLTILGHLFLHRASTETAMVSIQACGVTFAMTTRSGALAVFAVIVIRQKWKNFS